MESKQYFLSKPSKYDEDQFRISKNRSETRFAKILTNKKFGSLKNFWEIFLLQNNFFFFAKLNIVQKIVLEFRSLKEKNNDFF